MSKEIEISLEGWVDREESDLTRRQNPLLLKHIILSLTNYKMNK